MDIIRDILSYWMKQIVEKVFYLGILILLGVIFLTLGTSYGRYLDAWLE